MESVDINNNYTPEAATKIQFSAVVLKPHTRLDTGSPINAMQAFPFRNLNTKVYVHT